MDYLAKPQEAYVPVVFDRHALLADLPLRTVCHASEPGNIQVFYRLSGDKARVWVVDELGSVFSWEQGYVNRRYLLVPLLRFLENLIERRQLRQLETVADIGGTRCYEMVLRDGQWHAERRPDADSNVPLPGLEVQAIGIQEGDSRVRFDIFCGDQEFTVQEYGNQLIPAVAHYIRSFVIARNGIPCI